MRTSVIVFLLLITIILFSGCTQIIKPSSKNITAIPTPLPTPKYQFGDVLKENPDDASGKLIMSYNPSGDSYTTRSIINDEFGRLYYLGSSGDENIRRDTLERSYTIQSGHVENPSEIQIKARDYNPKYSAGDILTEGDYARDGIIIIRYDYSSDNYRYRLVRSTNGPWMFSFPDTIDERRTVIEAKYTKRVTNMDPKSVLG